MNPSIVVWIAVVASAVLAGILQSITGFGAAVIMMAVLGYFMDLVQAGSVVTLVTLALAALILIPYRKDLQTKRMLLPIIIFLAFSTSSILLLNVLNLTVLSLIFACSLIALSAYYLFFHRKHSGRYGLAAEAGFSAVSGICAGLFSMGGPTMAICFLQGENNRRSYIANLQFLFVVTGAVNFATRVVNRNFSLSLLPICGAGFIAIVLGRFAGQKVANHISRGVAEKIVYASVGASGIFTLVKTIV